MQGTRSRKIRPSSLELWYVVFFSVILIMIGNGKLILERLGLISSAHLIGQQVSLKTLSGVSWIDNFRFTASAINLVIWSVTGLIIYSILQAIVRGIRQVQFQRDFDTQLYIHPEQYTHRSYWQHVIIDSILGFLLLVLFVLGVATYVYAVVPDSFMFIQRFIYSPDLHHGIDPFIGLLDLCIGTAIVYLLLKLVIRHHRIATVVS